MLGVTLGQYRIEEKLGEGGMGVVYRATDTELDRLVAIKLLRSELVQDRQVLARFEWEARVLASLNHPNLASIYSVEESDGLRFLVLEFVPGQSLEQRLAIGPMKIGEALDVCRQIAEGIEAAHDRDIVHRDLKPSNIRLTDGGKVKILDFGLAKAVQRTQAMGADGAVTVTYAQTQAGTVLGTVSYMSPEQARGSAVDMRADVWAFGCLLYETLTGRKTFDGPALSDVIAAVLEREPDWSALPAGTPDNIRRLLRRCLRKDLQSRLRHIGDARIELQETVLTTPVPAAAPKQKLLAWAAGGLLAGILLTAAFAWALWP